MDTFTGKYVIKFYSIITTLTRLVTKITSKMIIDDKN